MSDEIKATPICESKKIGDVNLKGIIDGIEIQCNVDLKYSRPKDPIQSTLNKTSMKLGTKHYLCYFYIPLLLIATCFIIDLIFDVNSHLLLFILPLAFGYILYRMFTNSPTTDIVYIKKYVDFITLSSSVLTACLLLFKTVDSYNPYLAMIYSLKFHGVIGNFFLFIVFSTVYFVIWIFATSATIKCLFSFSELKNINKRY